MSILNVNQLQPVGGGNTITVGSSNIDYSGSITGNISVDGNLTVTGLVSYEDVTNIDSVGVITARNGLHVTGGNVGINETSPQQQLHVHDDTDYHGIFVNGNAAPRVNFARNTTTTAEWSVGIDGTNGNNFAIAQAGNTAKLIIDASGNIGISDATPENALTIKNIGSFEGDANSFYLGSNFTGTGQNFSGSGKHAQRFFFNNASSNGYLKYENTGTTGNAGDAITWQERLRITSGGELKIPAGIGPQITFENQHGHTGDAVISTYDDGVGTLLCLGSNFYFNSSGAETRWYFSFQWPWRSSSC